MKWLAIALAMVWFLDAIRLRARIGSMQRLTTSGLSTSEDYHILLAEGVEIPDSTLRNACAHAVQEGLKVLDLAPGNWPADRFFTLSQLVDLRTYRRDRLATGRSAGHATLVHRQVLERLPQARGWNLADTRIRLPRYQLLRLAPLLKRYACTETDLAVAPGLTAVPDAAGRGFAHLKETYGNSVRFVVLGLPLMLAIQVLLVLTEPLFGGIALGMFQLQPLIVLVGTPVTSWGAVFNSLFRFPLELGRWLTIVTSTWRAPESPDLLPDLRVIYRQLLSRGTDPFFEDRAEECPLCQNRNLSPLLSSPDLVQHKPGVFVLEECGGCGHIFQNPRLSLVGLEFYYRDFYGGLASHDLEALFGFTPNLYLARAKTLQNITTPRRWLDVGGGHGHFCCVARDVWPETIFDGLDLTQDIEEGMRRGWIDQAYRGMFPEIAPSLEGVYDVVSMFHYLEHTREPRKELAAAHRALGVGGYLLIEVPNPDCPIGRKLGKWWFPWFQPQHQHLISTTNMDRLLREAGFEPIFRQTRLVQPATDLTLMASLMLNRIAPPARKPWLAPLSLAGRFPGQALLILGMPFLALAWLADRIRSPFLRDAPHGDAYRMLARKTAA